MRRRIAVWGTRGSRLGSLPPQFDATDTASAVLGHYAMIPETSGLAPSTKDPVNRRRLMLIHDRLSPLAAQQTDVRAQFGPTASVSAVLWRLETPQLSIRSPVGKRVEVDEGVARPWSEVQLPHLDTCGSMEMLAPGASGDPDGAKGHSLTRPNITDYLGQICIFLCSRAGNGSRKEEGFFSSSHARAVVCLASREPRKMQVEISAHKFFDTSSNEGLRLTLSHFSRAFLCFVSPVQGGGQGGLGSTLPAGLADGSSDAVSLTAGGNGIRIDAPCAESDSTALGRTQQDKTCSTVFDRPAAGSTSCPQQSPSQRPARGVNPPPSTLGAHGGPLRCSRLQGSAAGNRDWR